MGLICYQLPSIKISYCTNRSMFLILKDIKNKHNNTLSITQKNIEYTDRKIKQLEELI